jgi:hypothetical protein
MSDSTESPNAGYIDRLLRLATIEASKFIAEAQRFVGPPLFLADDGTFALAPPAAVNSYTCVDYYARLGVPYPVYLALAHGRVYLQDRSIITAPAGSTGPRSTVPAPASFGKEAAIMPQSMILSHTMRGSPSSLS